jgi:hypothetical protein
MNESVKANLSNASTWKRVLFIIIFWFIFNLVELLIGVLVFFQVLALLFGGERNGRVQDFSNQLSLFAYDVLQYVTFNRDERPFPFQDWGYGPTDTTN